MDSRGFLAVSMVKGKTKGEAPFQPEQAQPVEPVGVRDFVSWTEGKEGELQWRFANVAGKKLKEVASFSGDFAGFLYPCAVGEGAAVGIWGRGQGELDAKPTKGDDTAVAVSFLKDGKWTQPVTEVMPFRRKITASRCGADQVQVSWASSEGEELEVGQISCTPEACTRVSSKWSSFGAKRWLAAGPVGNQFVALWTTELGDTRMRHGDLANFASGTEAPLFEEPSRGGPVFRDAVSYFTVHGAYLVVTDKAPTVLQLVPSGTVQALSGK